MENLLNVPAQTPNGPPTGGKKKMSKKAKVAMGVAGLFVVGGIGAAVSGGPDEKPATEVSQPAPATESPEPVVTPEPTTEPVEPTTEPEPEVVAPQPEPPAPVPAQPEPVVPGTDATTGETVPDAPTEYFPGDFDLSQAEDDEFVKLVIAQAPYAEYANPEAMVNVAMDTCAWIANGGTQDEMLLIANGVYAPGSGEWEAASAAIILGNAYYCPQFYK